MHFPNSRIIVFAKAPIAGQVKTRLNSVYNIEYTAALHAALVTHTLAVAGQIALAPIELWCAPDSQHPFFTQCADAFGIELYTQVGSDLGERMSHAFAQVLTRAEQAIIVGCDCPARTATYLETAFTLLTDGRGVVIGPANDGGYTLLGLRTLNESIFNAMAWGTDQVLSTTLNRLNEAGLDYCLLPSLDDIDFPEDLDMFIAQKDSYELHADLRHQLELARSAKHPNLLRTETA